MTALFLIIVALGGCKTQKEEKTPSVSEEKTPPVTAEITPGFLVSTEEIERRGISACFG
jgi:hypothetical protein